LDITRQCESIILHCYVDDNNIVEIKYQPISLDGLYVAPECKTKFRRLSTLIHVISNPIVWYLYKVYLNIIYKAYFYFWGNGRNPIKQLKSIDGEKIQRAKEIIGLNK